MSSLARNVLFALVATALLSPLPCQKYANWLPDLGDEAKTESAERALVAMGAKAILPLGQLIDEWDTSTPRERARCLAILRVVSLLGEEAASLAVNLKQCGIREPGAMVAEIADTLATLEPYAGDSAWHELFHHSVSAENDVRGRAMQGFVRLVSRQQVRSRDNFESLKKALAKDAFGGREVVAEAMAKLGNQEAIDLLRERLLDRDKKPSGWDQLRHNGWVVPMEDQFGLRAGNALIALAPTDPRAAIGFANRALHHPHRSVRIDAVRQMAMLGPAASDAIPELMRIAAQDDPVLALEALKVLGMAGKDVGKHLLAIDAIASNGEGAASRVAKGLAARLRAMGCETVVPDAETAAREATLAKLDQSLDQSPDATVLEQIATNEGMWPRLAARFQKQGAKTPDLVFDLLARVAWLRSEKERTNMQYCLANLAGNNWNANMMSSSSGGGLLSAIHYYTHARIGVDPASPLEDLVKLLKDENPFVRQVAAERLATRVNDWATANLPNAVHAALLEAADAEHPKKFKLERARNSRSTENEQNTPAVQTAAAIALAGQAVPDSNAAKLLKAVARSTNEAAVVQAIDKWTLGGAANEAVAAELSDLAKGKRAAVAAAAKAALARLQAK